MFFRDRDRDRNVFGWTKLRHSALLASPLDGLLKLRTWKVGINDMRLRVGGGTGQALCRAVKQPTTTKACQLVGPELADRVFAVAHEVES